ncbi:hypothetical protein, partial [Phascolarctobacterium succinatutens]|uniref:hypothetical protein n=1 Tax=Phascolarctobacterium succinatutens TaxID=626940 RepID=UPI0023F77357
FLQKISKKVGFLAVFSIKAAENQQIFSLFRRFFLKLLLVFLSGFIIRTLPIHHIFFRSMLLHTFL